jgi:hypothetical protein
MNDGSFSCARKHCLELFEIAKKSLLFIWIGRDLAENLLNILYVTYIH